MAALPGLPRIARSTPGADRAPLGAIGGVCVLPPHAEGGPPSPRLRGRGRLPAVASTGNIADLSAPQMPRSSSNGSSSNGLVAASFVRMQAHIVGAEAQQAMRARRGSGGAAAAHSQQQQQRQPGMQPHSGNNVSGSSVSGPVAVQLEEVGCVFQLCTATCYGLVKERLWL